MRKGLYEIDLDKFFPYDNGSKILNVSLYLLDC